MADFYNNKYRLNLTKLLKVEDVFTYHLKNVISSEFSYLGSNLACQLIDTLDLNDDQKIVKYQLDLWDLSMVIKLIFSLPFGRRKAAVLIGLRKMRNLLAHPPLHTADDSEFFNIFKNFFDLGQRLQIPEALFKIIFYEDIKKTYNSEFERISESANNAMMEQDYTEALEIVQFGLVHNVCRNINEKLYLLEISKDICHNLGQQARVQIFQGQIDLILATANEDIRL